MKALFFLVYSMQSALSNLIERSHGELECQRFVSFRSFRFMKSLIKKLAHMDKQKQYKPLFSGACTDLYKNLKRMNELNPSPVKQEIFPIREENEKYEG